MFKEFTDFKEDTNKHLNKLKEINNRPLIKAQESIQVCKK